MIPVAVGALVVIPLLPVLVLVFHDVIVAGLCFVIAMLLVVA